MFQSLALIAAYAFSYEHMSVGETFAAFAMGCQNSMTSYYSGAILRTSHMTGIVTDIGCLLGQMARCDKTADTWKLGVFIPLLLGFLTGGAIGGAIYMQIQEAALLISAGWTFFVSLFYFYHAEQVLLHPINVVSNMIAPRIDRGGEESDGDTVSISLDSMTDKDGSADFSPLDSEDRKGKAKEESFSAPVPKNGTSKSELGKVTAPTATEEENGEDERRDSFEKIPRNDGRSQMMSAYSAKESSDSFDDFNETTNILTAQSVIDSRSNKAARSQNIAPSSPNFKEKKKVAADSGGLY
jgi:hypothetical protein